MSSYHCRIGPVGSAVCAYRADNSLTPQGTGGHNRGIFDIFRSDIQVVNQLVTEEENTFVEVRYCTQILYMTVY